MVCLVGAYGVTLPYKYLTRLYMPLDPYYLPRNPLSPLLENVLTPYGVSPRSYVGVRAISRDGDVRFISTNPGPGYLITLTRKLTAPIKPCCTPPCPIPVDSITIPLREGSALIDALGKPIPPRVGLTLYTHIPPFTFKYENTIDVPPYWAGALLAKGCSKDDAITIPIPTREHFEVMENYNTQFYYINRVPTEALPTPLCVEPIPRAATMPGVYGFTSYLTYTGRPELSLDLEAIGILGMTWSHAYIPSNYQHAVYWERLAFLRGVMDYRGTVTDKGVAQLFIISAAMLEDLHYLVRRLGGWTTITTCGCCDDVCGWLVNILLPNGESPFHVTPEGYIAPTSVMIPPWVVTNVESSDRVTAGGMVSPGSTYFIYPDILVGEV